MTKSIAFLRAINVGGHTVKMEQLRSLFEDLGLSHVETFIASGNVIFNAHAENIPALENRIEGYLQESLGYKVATFIRSTPELAEIARHKPFSDSELNAEGHGLYIGFLAAEPGDEARQKLLACATPVDDFHIHGREVYWLCRTRFSQSEFSGARLEKTLGMQTTLRNVTTIKKLISKFA